MVTSMETPGQCIRMVTMLVSPLILQDLLGRLPELLHGDLLHIHPLPAELSTESRYLSYSSWSMSFPSQLIPARGLPAFLHPQHLRSPPHHPIIPALGQCRVPVSAAVQCHYYAAQSAVQIPHENRQFLSPPGDIIVAAIAFSLRT